MQLIRKPFGNHQGCDIDLFTIGNERGLVVSVTNYGATVTGIRMPDRRGIPGNVVLGYHALADYIADERCCGALIGRCANRIGNARFTIDGRVYRLSENHGHHHYHGGFYGFGKKIWAAVPIRESRGCGLSLTLSSPDGDEGYPGTVDVRALFLLTTDNELIIDYQAASDHATVLNLTQNLAFNLGGGRPVDDHILKIQASGYIPTTPELIPLGTLRMVDRSPLDFRTPRKLGQALVEVGTAGLFDGDFDHHFVLDSGGSLSEPAAGLYHRASGRLVTISSTQPGINLYTARRVEHRLDGDGGNAGRPCAGVGLIPEFFPDSPNHRAFPSVILPAGRLYRQTIRYRFECRK